jgi:hypothetical protein
MVYVDTAPGFGAYEAAADYDDDGLTFDFWGGGEPHLIHLCQ